MSNCYRCDAAIIPGQASRRKEELRQIVSSDGKQETHYSKELICKSCVTWEWAIMARNWGFIFLGAFVVFGVLEKKSAFIAFIGGFEPGDDCCTGCRSEGHCAEAETHPSRRIVVQGDRGRSFVILVGPSLTASFRAPDRGWSWRICSAQRIFRSRSASTSDGGASG